MGMYAALLTAFELTATKCIIILEIYIILEHIEETVLILRNWQGKPEYNRKRKLYSLRQIRSKDKQATIVIRKEISKDLSYNLFKTTIQNGN